ncbi:MAG: ABC transporter ATP-binding protein [Alphaproteobacteria bacterium]|nr:ABC transporter ATP-binding protein [Alphaproteobacteria bacterium]MDE2493956.1 ABC transporter ATP-binding protein [Alphaproteobacteria bacterium]
MADDTVIRVENLGKKYIIGHQAERERYTALRDVMARNVKSAAARLMGRGPKRAQRVTVEEFWALKGVDFEVGRGEVLGIIGRNGAGKSTLLKILSRITEPSEGRASIHGRVASLLEVGTGFHPELTGRENIFLNGAVLGMTHAEIRRKFDEIVTFAEVDKFLDTPVKRFSSGMYVRLAFAVAAHLEPEILVVDEVLAVGDAEFQKRCLGKMRSISTQSGRTVLFVSHNMGAVQSLCSSAILLEQGCVMFCGSPEQAVQAYSRNRTLQSEVADTGTWSRTGTGEARVISVRLEDGDGNPQMLYRMAEPLVIVMRAEFPQEVTNPTFGVNIVTDSGVRVADCRSSHYGVRTGKVKGIVEYRARIDSLALYPRSYSVEPWVANAACTSDYDWVRNAAEFEVSSGPNFIGGVNVNASHGVMYIPTSWEVRAVHTSNFKAGHQGADA